MGCYINPPDMSKEEFLEKYGVLLEGPPHEFVPYQDDLDLVQVCLVDNVIFTAAAVAYNKQKLEYFKEEDDERKRTWYLVPLKYLKKVSDIDTYIEMQ